jgi:glycosyltransferase involved in cell wall biosynthesis
VRLAYLFSRYPVVSQTFCDTEMLALERLGVQLEVCSIYPPPTSFRHGHAARMKAEIHYAPPTPILRLGEQRARVEGRWPAAFIAEHERRYGAEYKAALRARNALYFADLFTARGITHFHVHFANRAAQTALFIKHLSGIPFSITTHGQDFMHDLGSDDLLREICREAEFVANETRYSKGVVTQLCPAAAEKMTLVFNGMDLANFAAAADDAPGHAVPRLFSVGRLIEFKGFHHLIAACGDLRRRGVAFECDIVGEGPWRSRLEAAIAEAGVGDRVRLLGSRPQEEVFARLRASDIFVLPCIVDGNGASDVFPTVILEAMASARPVVSTRLAGVPEQVLDGETGLLTEPGDEHALADALARLLTAPELRRKYGQAGRRRLETEYLIEHTVQPLHALFEQKVKPSAPSTREPAGLACLLHEWPAGERAEAELRQLREAHPPLRAYAAQAAASSPTEAALASLPHLAFLPDGMVLEGEWQQEREAARRMETWRTDLGGKLSSEYFLQQARHALYLRRWLTRDGVRHLHAVSSRELLCAWMLHRLGGVTVSATVEEKPWLAPAVIERLAPDLTALRVCDAALHKSLLPLFTTPGRVLLHHRHGRTLEPDFLARLKAWSRPAGPL